MARRLVTVDRNTRMLLPPDLKEWIPQNHIVHFILEAVEGLPDHYFKYNERGNGLLPARVCDSRQWTALVEHFRSYGRN